MVLMPEGSGQWGLPPQSKTVNTSFYSARLPSMSSGDQSANPATSCASGRSGLWRAHISGSTRKRSGLWDARPLEEGFRAVSSDASCRFACTTRYKSRNQSREAGTSSRILTTWKLSKISHWVLQTIEKGINTVRVSPARVYGGVSPRWPPQQVLVMEQEVEALLEKGP